MNLDSRQIEIVVISYRSAPLVLRALNSWEGTFHVCVVDNAADADGLAESTRKYPEVRYLQMPSVGFTRAANAAVYSTTADFLVFVNPDSGATAQDIWSLAGGLSEDPAAICHAALEELGPGCYCGGGWEPTLRRSVVHALGLHRIFPKAGIIAITDVATSIDVDWVTGSVAAYRTSDLTAMGGFDERFYLYSEDVAFGHRARQIGKCQVVREDVLISPLQSGSGAPSHEMTRLQGASFANYLDIYGDSSTASMIKIILAFGFAGRALLAALTGAFSSSRVHLMFIAGLLTRKAFVAGNEVSQTRLLEIDPSLRIKPRLLPSRERARNRIRRRPSEFSSPPGDTHPE